MDPTDDALVAYLRTRAPGLPDTPFDPRAVTARARGALRHRRRRQLRTSVVAVAAVAATYVGLALAGPLPVPGGGTVSVPGSHALRALVARVIPDRPPAPDEWNDDVDRLEREVVPLMRELEIRDYLLEPGTCRILRYSRGDFSDQEDCEKVTPFDAQAVTDFNRMTDAVERTGLAVERIRGDQRGIYVQLKDVSWQYNWSYVYLPDGAEPPPTHFPNEQYTRIRDDWWFFRAHDD